MQTHPRQAEVGADACDTAQDAFRLADQQYSARKVKAQIASWLLSGLPGKNRMDRLKAQRTPLHPTGLTRSPSRVVNRAGRTP